MPPRRHPLRRLVERLDRLPRLSRALLGLATMFLVAALDLVTGPEISVSVFYLVPVALAAWYDGQPGGLVASVASAALWAVVNVLELESTSLAITTWNVVVRLSFFVLFSLTLAALRRNYDREAALGRTDPLTGLLNTRGFREGAEREVARARRTGSPLALVLLDLDDFKRVNDTLGHAEGDRLLEVLAGLLLGEVRRQDLVARNGGDELVLLLPDTGPEAAASVADKVLHALRRRSEEEGWPVGASLGWATWTSPPSVDEMLRVADGFMYEAKSSGKARVVGRAMEPSSHEPSSSVPAGAAAGETPTA